MKTRKTPSTLASQLYKRTIRMDPRTDRILANPVAHRNKKDDLCNNNQCANPAFKKIGFGQLPRRMMPQFKDVKEVRALLSRINVRFQLNVSGRFKQVPIHQLYPSQSEIRRSRAQDILQSWNGSILEQASRNPIIIAHTSVVDGHHRSEALKLAVQKGLLKKTDKVRVFAIDLPAWTVLSMANLFGYNKESHPF